MRAPIDTREKLQAYCAIESLRYYLLVESERAAVSYRFHGGGERLAEALDRGERTRKARGSLLPRIRAAFVNC